MIEKYIGCKLYGFCNGYFGRDSYEDKTIVFAGMDYIVVEHENGCPGVAWFKDMPTTEMCELVEDWMEINNY